MGLTHAGPNSMLFHGLTACYVWEVVFAVCVWVRKCDLVLHVCHRVSACYVWEVVFAVCVWVRKCDLVVHVCHRVW